MKKRIKVKYEAFSTKSDGVPRYAVYELEVDGPVTVLDVLKMLYREKDENISFESYCRQGLCAGCTVELNGRRVFACKTEAPEEMTIKPVYD